MSVVGTAVAWNLAIPAPTRLNVAPAVPELKVIPAAPPTLPIVVTTPDPLPIVVVLFEVRVVNAPVEGVVAPIVPLNAPANPVLVNIPVEGINDSFVDVVFCGRLPVFAVTHVGYTATAVATSSVIAVLVALVALPAEPVILPAIALVT